MFFKFYRIAKHSTLYAITIFMNEVKNKLERSKETSNPKCGIIMPISSMENYSAEHWLEVLSILKDVISAMNFDANLVSDSDDSGIIQKRIIQNIYNNDLIICDVSGKNPNVMFELGMRLAFDKPTIIIKDDKTDYTFDTSIIEHLSYPKDLRFTKILDFKENLKKKIEGTSKKYKEDPKYSTFLKNFGQYKIAHLEETEVSSDEYILSSLADIKAEIIKLKVSTSFTEFQRLNNFEKIRQLEKKTATKENLDFIQTQLKIFALANNIKDASTLDKHINELIPFIIKNDSDEHRFSNIQELREMILHEIPPF